MIHTNIVVVCTLSGLSTYMHGCGSGGSPAPPPLVRSCSKADPTGSDLQALHKMNYAYRISAKEPLLYGPSKKIFDFCAEDVDLLNRPKSDMFISSSSSASETSQKISAEVGVEGGFGCFRAAASMSASRASSSSVKSFRIDRKIQSVFYHVSLSTHDFYKRLTPDAVDSLTNDEPARIVDTYGEFFATEADYGGLLMSTSLIEMTEDDDETSVKAEAEASFGAGGIKLGVSTNSANSKSTAMEHRKLTILGGNQSFWLGLANKSDIPDAQRKWANSVSGDKMFLISAKMRPLWEILAGHNDAKSKEIEKYLKQQWADQTDQEYGESGHFAKILPCPNAYPQLEQMSCKDPEYTKSPKCSEDCCIVLRCKCKNDVTCQRKHGCDVSVDKCPGVYEVQSGETCSKKYGPSSKCIDACCIVQRDWCLNHMGADAFSCMHERGCDLQGATFYDHNSTGNIFQV